MLFSRQLVFLVRSGILHPRRDGFLQGDGTSPLTPTRGREKGKERHREESGERRVLLGRKTSLPRNPELFTQAKELALGSEGGPGEGVRGTRESRPFILRRWEGTSSPAHTHEHGWGLLRQASHNAPASAPLISQAPHRAAFPARTRGAIKCQEPCNYGKRRRVSGPKTRAEKRNRPSQ